MTTTWQFKAMDSFFFRDSRPMTAGEPAWIESVFPPTGRTLQGAIRTAILDYLNIDYEDFTTDKQLQKEIGDHNSMGQLNLTGPWLMRDDITYYPVPLDLVQNKQNDYALLTPSVTPIKSDIGNILMPQIKGIGYKTVENQYIDQQLMQTLLEGEIPDGLSDKLITRVANDPTDCAFADSEPKVGLARDNQTRKAIEGMLFAIAPVRLRQGVSLCINIDGLIKDRHPTAPFLQRLGGEGKLSHIQMGHSPILPKASIRVIDKSIQFKIVLSTHALMPVDGWLPKGYTRISEQEDPVQFWQGTINGIEIDIITACIGKPFKQGGWDHANHQARPLQAHIPAGSVYYCKAKAEDKAKILSLHGSKFGSNTEYGFGHMLIGKWQQDHGDTI